jgi:hypothetical protein
MTDQFNESKTPHGRQTTRRYEPCWGLPPNLWVENRFIRSSRSGSCLASELDESACRVRLGFGRPEQRLRSIPLPPRRQILSGRPAADDSLWGVARPSSSTSLTRRPRRVKDARYAALRVLDPPGPAVSCGRWGGSGGRPATPQGGRCPPATPRGLTKGIGGNQAEEHSAATTTTAVR